MIHIPMRKATRRKGTTLAELLVATVFLGICAASILGAVTSAIAHTGQAERRSFALGAAEASIEALRASHISSSPSTGSTIDTIPLPGGRSGTRTRVVALVSGYTDLYTVTVTLSWTESFGPDTITIETLVRAPDV
jgi:type II secretory pathway pseudopilin PulG